LNCPGARLAAVPLADLARYDDSQVSSLGDRAVVVGASMAGLLAGRVLADAFDEVTILDRDPLPPEPVARRGVPQADHVHVMLDPGRQLLGDLFPDFREDLLAAGGLDIDTAADLQYHQRGDFLVEGPDRLPTFCATRPLFDALVRRRLAAREDVTLRGECQWTDYRFDEAAGRVTGVEVRDADGDTDDLAADLVVDATGRTSGTPAWLDRNGYEAPPEDEVTIDLAYSTVEIERPPDTNTAYLYAPTPPATRGGTAIPVEGDRWIVTVFGVHGDHPPTDPDGVRAFADTLPTDHLADLLDTQSWASDDVAHYPFPSSRRRRYEGLSAFPDGLLVTGDAVASFNPIYGQGMSVAALDALALHHALADGLDDLGSQFFDRVGDAVDVVWRMTVGSDFAFDATTGPKPRGTALFNRYVDRVIDTAQSDAYVSDQLARVFRLEQPPMSLFAPGVLWRVLAPDALVGTG
jgi:2-polyprenyl-6-methoxyphenol hydroxylase-like FAD-dependent oxidoreductase